MPDRRTLKIGLIHQANLIKGPIDCEYCAFSVRGRRDELEDARKLVIKTLRLNDFMVHIYKRRRNDDETA